MLVALMAPRPVLLQTGVTDFWSDPKGEFPAAVAADPVYRLFRKQGLGTDRMPEAGRPILHTIGYLMHAGGHGIIPADWERSIRRAVISGRHTWAGTVAGRSHNGNLFNSTEFLAATNSCGIHKGRIDNKPDYW